MNYIPKIRRKFSFAEVLKCVTSSIDKNAWIIILKFFFLYACIVYGQKYSSNKKITTKALNVKLKLFINKIQRSYFRHFYNY